MIHALFILLTLAAVCLLVPALVVFFQVSCAVLGGSDIPQDDEAGGPVRVGDRPTVAILMPAHNEQLVIADSIRSLLPQLIDGDRLLVVADNCTDATASIAAAQGAEVIQRQDAQLRGKGYALDFGMRHLAAAAPQVVIIVDADCHTGAGAIDLLARLAAFTARPVQSLYLMRAGANAGLKTRIAEFAWLIRNQVRPLGLWKVGLPCQLMGTGMAFTWKELSGAQLATGHLVEDRRLGIDLACAGKPPLFCPQALVTSYFPSTSEGMSTQRTRWEHGSLSVIFSETPRLLVNALSTFSVRSLSLALDLSVPPLALMILLLLATWFASALLFAFSRLLLPWMLTSIAGVLFGVAVFLSWQCYARHVISLGSLLLAALQAFLKVPLYFKFLVARQSSWVRSRRDGE